VSHEVLLTTHGAFLEMLCLWVQINPQANITGTLQLSWEAGMVCLMCIIFAFIHDLNGVIISVIWSLLLCYFYDNSVPVIIVIIQFQFPNTKQPITGELY
jgi:hypothetical protein